MRRILAPLLAILVSLVAIAPTISGPSPETKRFWKLYRKADKKMEAERYEKAVPIWAELETLAPESPGPSYGLARSLAGLGDRDGAFEALDRAVELGAHGREYTERDEHLASLREDDRFALVLEGMQANQDRFTERMSTRHRLVPPSTAEPFASAQAVVDAFAEQFEESEAGRSRLGWHLHLVRHGTILDRKLATFERYLSDHPEAPDRELAMLETVNTVYEYKDGWEKWDGDAPLFLEKADRFLESWPESEHAAGVALERAVVTWKSFGEDDEEATLEARAVAARERFASVECIYPEADEARQAIVWQLAIAHEVADGVVSPEATAEHARLEPLMAEDEALADYAWRNAARVMWAFEGERSFDGVDLDGKRWTWETMRGRVVLIDFWATWCGPCIGELPHLKEAYEAYHDRGFEIVGVSLDGPRRKKFVRRCEEHGVVWPQIHDGGGWKSELARTFHIWGVPTPVLIDREGRVVAIDGGARGSELVEKVGELVAP